jgi:hypothetical protein
MMTYKVAILQVSACYVKENQKPSTEWTNRWTYRHSCTIINIWRHFYPSFWHQNESEFSVSEIPDIYVCSQINHVKYVCSLSGMGDIQWSNFSSTCSPLFAHLLLEWNVKPNVNNVEMLPSLSIERAQLVQADLLITILKSTINIIVLFPIP